MPDDFSSQEPELGAGESVPGTSVSLPEPPENTAPQSQPAAPPPMPAPPTSVSEVPTTPRAPVQVQPAEHGWWLASDGLWYPPESGQGAAAGNFPGIVSPAQGSQNIIIQMAQSAPAQYLGPPKSKAVAALLALFFGTLGVHRFYLGHSGSGAAMLILSLLLIGLPITIIWAVVDFILILVGGLRGPDGRPLS